jgi:multicomponent Na+:H+ antiporter subunit E
MVTADQKSDLGIVIYANSITLTPGTVSIDLEGNQISVHALTEQSAADLLTGEMNRRVCRVER